MNTLINKIGNSLPFMALVFYTEYFIVWAKSILSPQLPATQKQISGPNRIKIMHTVKS